MWVNKIVVCGEVLYVILSVLYLKDTITFHQAVSMAGLYTYLGITISVAMKAWEPTAMTIFDRLKWHGYTIAAAGIFALLLANFIQKLV